MFQLLTDDHSWQMLQTKRKTLLYPQSKLKDNSIVYKLPYEYMNMMQLCFRKLNVWVFLLLTMHMKQRSICRCLGCRVNKDGLKKKDIWLQLEQHLHHPIGEDAANYFVYVITISNIKQMGLEAVMPGCLTKQSAGKNFDEAICHIISTLEFVVLHLISTPQWTSFLHILSGNSKINRDKRNIIRPSPFRGQC